MARIAVIGGSGYAGRHIVAEAVSRGHSVLAIARRIPSERQSGAIYIEGSLTDVPDLLAQLQGVDVVVSAVAPRGDMQGLVRPNITHRRRVAAGNAWASEAQLWLDGLITVSPPTR